MKTLTLFQATEIAKAYYGPLIELVKDRSKISDRCTIYSVIYDEKWKGHRRELTHGRDWLEAICKVIPELAYKEFDCNGHKFTNYLAELREIRRLKASRNTYP